MTAKKKVKDLNPVGDEACGASLYEEFKGLLMNAVRIERTDGETLNYSVERYAKDLLIEGGSVGYDKITDKFYKVAGEGINDEDAPVKLKFTTANNKQYFRKACYDDSDDGAYIIYALPSNITFAEIIKRSTSFMSMCDGAITQNIEACKSPYIVVCKNEEMRLSYLQAIQEKQRGQAVLLVSEELGEGLKAVNITTNFLADKFRQEKDLERDYLFNRIGIMSANTSKRERVQSAEVNASLGQATDYIYMFIDTFNKQAESYKLPYKMSLNGALEELYNADEEPNVNEIEERENITNESN